jgi:RimJ/RimL family protein N-acetyltransferase
MLESLPICDGDLTIRQRTREDIDAYASWPMYPPPYEPFNAAFALRFAAMSDAERDACFQEWIGDDARIILCADREHERSIASLTFRDIDWESGGIGNMGFVMKPTHVEQGIGTRIMLAVSDWCLGHGITGIRFDVVACNTRAVRCYEKAGFTITGEFWKDEDALQGKDISLPEYDFMRPHVRVENGTPQIRFWWMELRTGAQAGDG